MKKLTKLLKEIEVIEFYGERKKEILGITEDSRKVKKGFVFIAVKGLRTDGHEYISDAIESGAIVIVGERKPSRDWLKRIIYVRVRNSRMALGKIASAWFNDPSEKLVVIGVTGTDGKTTTASLIYHLLITAGEKVGVITTIGAKIGEKEYDTGFHVTNPDPVPLQRLLSKALKEGCRYVVLEVTSHGLDQGRVEGVEFDAAVLTNITHEHLDYHKTIENYRQSKIKLFRKAKKLVVLNKDDQSFESINKKIKKGVEIISYGIKDKKAKVAALEAVVSGKEMLFKINMTGELLRVKTKLLGEYNLSNILAAVSVAKFYHVSRENIGKALASFEQLSGRLEEIENNLGITIYVDFAHTPNSLERLLHLLQKRTSGRLIVVFGCAGKRDIEKRKLMPKAAVRYADVSIFTAEDPREEKVEEIMKVMEKSAIKAGAVQLPQNYFQRETSRDPKRKYFVSVPERGEAISFAIQKLAKKGDIVAICGKGHEKSMAYQGIEYPWSDQEAVKVSLKGGVKKIKRK